MTLDDTKADDFFRQGDEGTYAGGPGDSIPAGVVNVFDDLDEAALPRLTREQIERRDRYTRWVKGFVSTLAVGAVLAFAVRAVDRGEGESNAVRPAAVQESPQPAAAPVSDFHAMLEPPAVALHEEPRATSARDTVASDAPKSTKVAADPPARKSAPVGDSAATVRPSTPKATPARAAGFSASSRAASARSIVPSTPPTVPVHSAPPTANFPP